MTPGKLKNVVQRRAQGRYARLRRTCHYLAVTNLVGFGGGGAGAVDIGDDIARSLRFNSPDSAYLSRTCGVPTDGKKWTFSVWLKRGKTDAAGGPYSILGGGTGGVTYGSIRFDTTSEQVRVQEESGNYSWLSSGMKRDPSAYLHLVVAYDSANGAAADRIKVYFNNVRDAGAYSTGVTLNFAGEINKNGVVMELGRVAATYHYDGNMAMPAFVDGQALTPSSFGRTSVDTGEWVPATPTGITWGTNGGLWTFSDNSNTTAATLGADTSGNGNNMTPNNFSVAAGVGNDSLLDTPTNTYWTIDPLVKNNSGVIPTNGNLDFNRNTTVSHDAVACQALPLTGKWFWELNITVSGANNIDVGVADLSGGTTQLPSGGNELGHRTALDYVYHTDGVKWSNNSSAAYGSAYGAGDVIGVAWDADNGTIEFYLNGASQGVAYSSIDVYARVYAPAFVSIESTPTSINFGQRPFAYAVPTGFKELCTANLPAPPFIKPKTGFESVIRTGTGAAASVTGLLFQPDAIIAKSRSDAYNSVAYDSVRGVQKNLQVSATAAESTEATGVTAFNADGYTMGALSNLNENAKNYINWLFKKSPATGFDIQSYVGDGTNRTIAHSLGAIPKLLFVRSRQATVTGRWPALSSYYNAARYTYWNEAFAFDSTNANTRWNLTDPTSSVFSLGTGSDTNHTGDDYVAYLWADVPGFQRIDSYVGNGSADGPFVNCGFKPRFIMLKNADATGSWLIVDTARDTYNVVVGSLFSDTSAAETTGTVRLDACSTGFKVRDSNSLINGNTNRIIFIAIADIPRKYARAR